MIITLSILLHITNIITFGVFLILSLISDGSRVGSASHKPFHYPTKDYSNEQSCLQ